MADTESVFTSKSSLSSILKSYSSSARENAKVSVINRVRFSLPKQNGIIEAVEAVLQRDDYKQMETFADFISITSLDDEDFLRIFKEAQQVVHALSPKFTILVEALLSQSWIGRSAEARQAYTEFCIGIICAHIKYLEFAIKQLISQLIPGDNDAEHWPNGTPTEERRIELQAVHHALLLIHEAIPLSLNVTLNIIKTKYPYFKKPAHVIAGFLHNVLWLLEEKPEFAEPLLKIVLQKIILLDTNAPRDEIEEFDDKEGANGEHEKLEDEDLKCKTEDEAIFEMDDCDNNVAAPDEQSSHPIAHTLDICMLKIFDFLKNKFANATDDNKVSQSNQQMRKQRNMLTFFKDLLNAFEYALLPTHDTHHVQFVMFYCCTFEKSIADAFLGWLWGQIIDPNVVSLIRQTAVGYLVSFLARANFLPKTVIKNYLGEMCAWAHTYTKNSDQCRSKGSLRLNMVFFSICQAIFYLIAFRSRCLTADKQDLLFLESLQLQALVTSNFNPLRVCIPTVGMAFADVMRTYQLAYCHAILERNARRQLATVYSNDTAKPDEILDTFFPFDPYILKLSASYIDSHYLHYQSFEAVKGEKEGSKAMEIITKTDKTISEDLTFATHIKNQRKRGDSEMQDDLDDFLFVDKRQKFMNDIAKSPPQFHYSVSPGF